MDQAALIDTIYEAGVAPEQWPRVLDGMAAGCDAEGALLMVATADAFITFRRIRICSVRWSSERPTSGSPT